MFFQGLGVAAFTNRKPDPIPTFFGYHEVFHVCVTLAGFCALVCNYSIVQRCCGGGVVADNTTAVDAAAAAAAAAEGLELWEALACLFGGTSVVIGLTATSATTTATTATTAASATASSMASATQLGSAVLS
jgi:hypothetical protein